MSLSKRLCIPNVSHVSQVEDQPKEDFKDNSQDQTLFDSGQKPILDKYKHCSESRDTETREEVEIETKFERKAVTTSASGDLLKPKMVQTNPLSHTKSTNDTVLNHKTSRKIIQKKDSFQCKLCNKNKFPAKINLITHYANLHFKKKLKKYVDEESNTCKLCEEKKIMSSVPYLYTHVGYNHQKLKNLLPAEHKNLLFKTPSARGKENCLIENKSLPTEDVQEDGLICRICSFIADGTYNLKMHHAEHFRKEIEESFIGENNICIICQDGRKRRNVFAHIATKHDVIKFYLPSQKDTGNQIKGKFHFKTLEKDNGRKNVNTCKDMNKNAENISFGQNKAAKVENKKEDINQSKIKEDTKPKPEHETSEEKQVDSIANQEADEKKNNNDLTIISVESINTSTKPPPEVTRPSTSKMEMDDIRKIFDDSDED